MRDSILASNQIIKHLGNRFQISLKALPNLRIAVTIAEIYKIYK